MSSTSGDNTKKSQFQKWSVVEGRGGKPNENYNRAKHSSTVLAIKQQGK